MRNPIIVALDLDDAKEASRLATTLAPHVGGFKIGPRLTLRADRGFLKDLSQAGVLFFDHKFFDIPSTTVASVRIAAELGATWVTVHALSGSECLLELAKLENEIRVIQKDFRVLAVTVLTSFSKAGLPPIWRDESVEQSVVKLAQNCYESGIKGFVCSPEEIRSLKAKFKDGFFAVPGIRLRGSILDDQKRVASPNEALKAGANALIIGRPIIAAIDPVGAAKVILESLH